MSSRSLESYRQVCLIRVGAKLCRTLALQDRSFPSLRIEKQYTKAVVPNPGPDLEAPWPARFACLLNQTHLIQVISSLVEIPRPEIGMSEKGDVQCWGASRTRVGNHCFSVLFLYSQGWATSVLEGQCPAEFRSNPNQTHLPVTF